MIISLNVMIILSHIDMIRIQAQLTPDPEGLMVGPGAATAAGVDAEALAGVVVVVPQAAAAVPAGVGENLRARQIKGSPLCPVSTPLQCPLTARVRVRQRQLITKTS